MKSKETKSLDLPSSSRIELRELTVDDDDFILNLYNQPSFLKHIGDRGLYNKSDVVKYIENGPLAAYESAGYHMFLIVNRSDGLKVGVCGLIKRGELPYPDLGFGISEDFRGHGFATEACYLIIEFARKQLSLTKILAVTSKTNKPSIGLLEKLGFNSATRTKLKGYKNESLLLELEINPNFLSISI